MKSPTTTAPTNTHPLTNWSGADIVKAYVEKLPTALEKHKREALAALESGNGDLCKVYAAVHLDDPYCRAIGYLSSVSKVTAAGLPTLATLLSEAARSAAEAWAASDTLERAEADIKNNPLPVFSALNQQIFEKALKATE